MPARRVLQLDFDGTLIEGDASVAILARFAGPEWPARVEAASRALLEDPDSPQLVQAMSAGFAALAGSRASQLSFVRENHPLRPGLVQLIKTAVSLGCEPHIVSNGYEFYIRDYLRSARVEDAIALHCGVETLEGLVYRGPDGGPVTSRFKQDWTESFLASGCEAVYAGDGASDFAAASLCPIVFARDRLLELARPSAQRLVIPFDTSYDIADGLRRLFA